MESLALRFNTHLFHRAKHIVETDRKEAQLQKWKDENPRLWDGLRTGEFYVRKDGKVACSTCGGNCGQCGNTGRLGNIGFSFEHIVHHFENGSRPKE